ncbi:uncharacterized protein CEXT_462861 [Caerostris extrusa]|uniref:Exophilin 5 n=1 Tax=Caerostris extrusa TaxID=172846 RepID=A0AAV4MDK3_CAEEX|nr:uncharacterized protein CEXT_462861 [Caerostris extrusa]
MNVVHRRSSCLSQGISKTNSENVEKRLSVDLSQYNLPENGTSKKGPPPPVPVKPKIKPKTFPDLPKAESIKTNGYKENEHLNSNGSIHGSCNIPSDVANHENLIIKESFSNKKDNESHLDEVEDNIKETNDNSLATKVNEEIKNMQHVSFSEYNRSPSPPINNIDINYSPANIENIETKPGDFITGENSESALNENSCSACVDNILPSDL